MPRDDYIRRLIVEMGRMWSRLVGLIKSRQLPAARAAIAEAYQQILGLPADAAQAFAPRELVARLMIGETPDEGRDKCVALAALLKASGDIDSAEGDDDGAAEAHRKALDILLIALLNTSAGALPDYAPSIADVVGGLSMYELPLETNLLLLRYYEQTGAFANAENVLFEMLDATQGATDLVALGQAFYARLSQLSDDQLIAGDLPRRETEAGLRELRRYTHAAGDSG